MMDDKTERARLDEEIVREMIHRANRESQLLDGRDYDTRIFEEAYDALARLLAKRDAFAVELVAAEEERDDAIHNGKMLDKLRHKDAENFSKWAEDLERRHARRRERARLIELAEKAQDIYWWSLQALMDVGIDDVHAAAFIEAASPEVVLALSAELDTAEKERTEAISLFHEERRNVARAEKRNGELEAIANAASQYVLSVEVNTAINEETNARLKRGEVVTFMIPAVAVDPLDRLRAALAAAEAGEETTVTHERDRSPVVENTVEGGDK